MRWLPFLVTVFGGLICYWRITDLLHGGEIIGGVVIIGFIPFPICLLALGIMILVFGLIGLFLPSENFQD